MTNWEHLQFPYRKIIASIHKSHVNSTDGIRFLIAPHNPESLFSTLAFQKKVNKQWITLCTCIGRKALSTWTDWSGGHLSSERLRTAEKKTQHKSQDKREPDSPDRPRVTVKTTQKLQRKWGMYCVKALVLSPDLCLSLRWAVAISSCLWHFKNPVLLHFLLLSSASERVNHTLRLC